MSDLNRDFTFSLDDEGMATPHRGSNYLLAIGIDAYRDDSIPNLRNAKRDAEQIGQLLSKRYLFEEDHISTLFNEQANKKNIIKELDRLVNKIKAEDNLLFYFSGHGYLRKKGTGRLGYLVPSDAALGDYDSLLPNSTLLDYLPIIDAKHILFVVDSCYSGSLITQMRDVPSFEKLREGIAEYASRVGKKRSRMGLAAGRMEAVADGIGEHSPFTTSLLNILEHNTIADFPSSELFQKVKTHTTIKANQTPISGVLAKGPHEDGEFVFHLRPNESQDWKKATAEHAVKSYKVYLQRYPKGEHIEQAWWNIAELEDNKQGYRDYTQKFPGGTYYKKAVDGMKRVEEREAFETAKSRGEGDLLEFLMKYPDGQYAQAAREEIARIQAMDQEPRAWQAALQGGEQEVQAYLDQYPDGAHAANAKKRLTSLRQQKKQQEAKTRQMRAREQRARKEAERKKKEEIARQKPQNQKKEEKKVSEPKAQAVAQRLVGNSQAKAKIADSSATSSVDRGKAPGKRPAWFIIVAVLCGSFFVFAIILPIAMTSSPDTDNKDIIIRILGIMFCGTGATSALLLLTRASHPFFLPLLSLGISILLYFYVITSNDPFIEWASAVGGLVPIVFIWLSWKARQEKWIG